jgi:hypothetical protein
MKKEILIFILVFGFVNSQNFKTYKFDFYDGKDYLFTLNQSDLIVLNSSRYIQNELFSNKKINKNDFSHFTISSLITTLLLQPITHEEGHRSVLSEEGINAISKPIFDKNLVAKVIGVRDQQLIDLRNNKLPTFIRLHTGGLESDYNYLNNLDMYFNFEDENYNLIYPDYIMRKMGVGAYYLSNLFRITPEIEEENNELKRDIVGHDLFGMIKNLHRPNIDFYRYTNWDDLTNEEKKYAHRMGYLSIMNFINPNVWQNNGFYINDNTKLNFSLNYSLAPFGDFTEQNIYLSNKKLKIKSYFRQYYNKSNTFFGIGTSLYNYPLKKNILVNSSVDFWTQPKDLDFNISKSIFGIGFKTEVAYKIFDWNLDKKSVYFNLGLNYKTKGFIPSSPSLNEDFRLNLGLILSTTK